jgi:hypothetical protein
MRTEPVPIAADPLALRRLLTERLSLDELRTLAADLGVDYEDLPAQDQGRNALAREFVAYLARRGRLSDLLVALLQLFPELSQAQQDPTNPYLGLATFDEADAGRFFGRKGLIATLVEHAARSSFVAVMGASGSGKSSVVRAGLIPALKNGAIRGSERWQYTPILRPGAQPFEALADVLGELHRESLAGKLDLQKQLESDPMKLYQTAGILAGRHGTRLVLVIDQAEELWTLAPQNTREAFIRTLVAAVLPPATPMLVVFVMRADFFHRLLEMDTLATLVRQHLEPVSLLNPDELREAISQPAAAAGGRFEPGLVDMLADEAAGQPGMLPLLQHTLHLLWQTRDRDGLLRFAAYHTFGGVGGALTHSAEEVVKLHYPTDEAQARLRSILLRLVQVGEGIADTRRRMSLAAIVPSDRSMDDVLAFLQPLVTARLLTILQSAPSELALTDEHAPPVSVEITHESLIRAWPLLRKWVDDSRAELQLQRQLTEQAQEWDDHNREQDYLYRGTRLAAVVEWANAHPQDLSKLEQEFHEASVAAGDAERRSAAQRRRTRTIAIVLAVMLLLVAVVGAVNQLENVRRANSPWQPLQTLPYEDSVGALAAVNGSHPDFYVATINIGVWRSDDLINWTVSRAGLPTGIPAGGETLKNVRAIQALTIDPLDSRHLAAAVTGHGISLSDDGGENWLPVQTAGLPDVRIRDVARYGDHTLVIAGDRQLYLLDDGADSWRRIGDEEQLGATSVIQIVPESHTIYIGTQHGLYRGTIGEWLWEPVTIGVIGITNVEKIALVAGTSDLDLALVDEQERVAVYRWSPGSAPRRLSDGINDQITALVSRPQVTYALTKSGRVIVLREGSKQQDLYQEPGPAYDLLLIADPITDRARLILGHWRGLLEYQSNIADP